MNSNPSRPRRSLKETLRTILLRCRRQTPVDPSTTFGSGILRKDPSLPTLSNESTTAFLLGLESIHYDDDENYANDIPDRFDISSLATSAAMSSTRTLMPKMSLSQFDTYHPPIQEARYLQRRRCDSVSSSLAEGASYQASLISLSSCKSTSTLRIQRSSQTLVSESNQSYTQPSFPERLNEASPKRDDSSKDSTRHFSAAFHCPSPPRTSQNLSPRRSLLRKRSSINDISLADAAQRTTAPIYDVDVAEDTYHNPYSYSSRFSRPLSVIEEVASSVDEPLTPRRTPTPQQPRRSRTPTSNIAQAHSSSTSSSVRSDATNLLLSAKHFSSFCALDMVNPGCPVTATSKELRYIFEIGDNFCLNNQNCEGTSIDVITGADAAGNPVTHLAIMCPLIIPHSGRSRFMLASLVDITDFLHDTASLPDLEMILEEAAEYDPPTPTCRSQHLPQTPRYQLSAENLLGGCFVDEPHTPVRRYNEDIWIHLATEERKQYSQRTNHEAKIPASPVSTLSSVDSMLETFMCKMQELYSEFFLLAKSPLDDSYYEICNVSPKVYEQRDYVNGHLSKTSGADMFKLSGHLAGEDAFDMKVRWGTQGVPKHLYCIPLFARSAVTWICFLVDGGLPNLW